MRRILILLVFVTAFQTADAQKANQISNSELVELLKDDKLQLVDVRTTEEVADGFIKGSMNINFYDPEFESKIGGLDKEKPIAVYCAAGGRSGKARKKLEKLGFLEIYDLSEGFGGWKQEGYPVENN